MGTQEGGKEAQDPADEPADAGQPPRGPSRRALLWSLLAIHLAVVIIAGAVGFGVWLTHHDALTFGSYTHFPAQRISSPVPDRDTTVAEIQEGQPFEYGFSIRNQDKVTVTITDLPSDAALDTLFPGRQVLLAPRHFLGGAREDDLTRFQPFELEPDEERQIYFRGVFENCDMFGERNSHGLLGQEVRFKILGFERSQLVAFRDALAFWNGGPSTPQCPLLLWPGGTVTPRNPPRAEATFSRQELTFASGGASYRLTLSSYRYSSASTCPLDTVGRPAEGVPVGFTVEPVDKDRRGEPLVLRLSMRDAHAATNEPLDFETNSFQYGPACRSSDGLKVDTHSPQLFMLRGTAFPPPGASPDATVDVALQENGGYRALGSLTLSFPSGPTPLPTPFSSRLSP